MLRSVVRTFNQLGDPPILRVILLCAILSLAILTAVVAGVIAALALVEETGIWWLDRVIEALGGIGAVILAVLAFPGIAALVASLFADRIAAAVEARHYPTLGPPRDQPVAEALVGGLRFFAVLTGANLVAVLLVLFIPVVNVLAFLIVNGWLAGREFFEAVAARRVDRREADRMRGRAAGRVFVAGLLIAIMLTIPLLNLLVPVVGVMLMTHEFQRMAPAGPA